MSIHPNRVLARIIEQVDASDWPRLASELHWSEDGRERIRLYHARAQERYATPFHFWVHALRDELETRARGEDLMGVAGYALGQKQSVEDWRDEVGPILALDDTMREDAIVYVMQAGVCRRSSVVHSGEDLWAHFWGHGPNESWRRKAIG